MFAKLIKWLFGNSAASTVGGIAAGAVTGAAGVAATGVTDQNALITGAVIGAASALSGAAGRGTGESND